ncbi:hypothetical protein [Sandarakinorhabdus sp.]|uniref:hypothetical protein n=1 Tax=Sandarakinorhabdus sp. TaxID=1916663 RepID=UPI0035639ECF
MPDRPMIFPAPMILALLAGNQTQTLRLLPTPMPPQPAMDAVSPMNIGKELHPAPYFDAYCGQQRTAANPRGMSGRWCWWTRDDRMCHPTVNVGYVPGDRLWVREAHYLTDDGDHQSAVYAADADAAADHLLRVHQIAKRISLSDEWLASHIKKRPSTHMPRWASRLTLTVTDVRVPRLHYTDAEAAMIEGAPAYVVALNFTVAQHNIDAPDA